MTFIDSPDFQGAESAPNYEKILMTRPNVMAAWDGLLDAIKENQDFRTYELATLAAAKKLKSSYCLLAHGSVLAEQEMSLDDVADIVAERTSGKLTEKEEAVVSFAGKVVESPGEISQSDIDSLRSHGLSDPEIFDIAATAAARSFLTRLMDSLGVQPDSRFSDLPESVRNVLVVGRPIEGSA